MARAEKFVRLFEAGSRLGVTTQTVRNWIKNGNLPEPTKVGPRTRGWFGEDFQRIIAQKKARARK